MTFKYNFEPTNLREYDIRGIVDKTLHLEDAYAVGRVFGSIIIRNGGKRSLLVMTGAFRLHRWKRHWCVAQRLQASMFVALDVVRPLCSILLL